MIAEFIGCTGSGKTTLIEQVQARLAETTQVVTAHEVISRRIGLGAVGHPTAQNLVEEMVCFPYLLRSLPRHRVFLTHTFRMFMRNSHPSLTTLSNIRSLVRKVGGYEIILRHHHDTIVLVDEGPIQAAHMLASGADSLSATELDLFAGLLPLPHLIVYVRCPVSTLVERTLKRPDPPREIRSKSREDAALFIADADTVFHRLVQTEALHSRLLTVENAGHTQCEYDDLVEQVARCILSHGPEHYPTVTPEQFIPGVS